MNEAKKFFIITYGCQMNEHESERLAGILTAEGYAEASAKEEADVIVFNTCCVRENAEQRAYGNIGALKKLKEENPSLIIAVGGCMTQQKGAAEKLRKTLPFVDIIFGTDNLHLFGEMLRRRMAGQKKITEITDTAAMPEGTPFLRSSYPNAWVNVMYGCNNFCTYCIVPYVKGRERSRRIDDVKEEVARLVCQGYKEITLLGQNVNSYGKDLDEKADFSDLLKEIADIDGRFRIRFMSNHPKDLTQKLAQTVASSPKICNSVHLPLQSGSDRILSLMNRHYTSADYLAEVRMLRETVGDIAITSDVMVGFPGETEEDFLATLSVVEQADFAGAFTFVYSPRAGTVAAAMDGQIPEEVKKDRIMRLVEAQNAINLRQAKKYAGRTVEVLVDDFDEKRGMYIGRDEHGKMTYFTSEKNIVGNFIDVKIKETNGISLIGDVIWKK